MIKKVTLLSMSLITVPSASTDVKYADKSNFNMGDVVHIDSCDKWQWCKLKDNTGYVKGHLFKRFPKDPSIAIKHKTTIENQGDIKHDSFSNIQIGVKYEL